MIKELLINLLVCMFWGSGICLFIFTLGGVVREIREKKNKRIQDKIDKMGFFLNRK